MTNFRILNGGCEGRVVQTPNRTQNAQRVDSKDINYKKIGHRVPEILSSKGKMPFQGKIQAKKSRPNSGHSGSKIIFLTYSENIGQMLRACKISHS